MPRRHGWLGGVCAGVAQRLGIDPILVRGVVVVVAVLGAPVALLYAVAWFLLPDQEGTIHAQELGHGRITRALPGIAGLFLLSFLPLAQGFWFAGSLYWGDPSWLGAILRVVWTAAVIVAVVVLVVWLARRSAATDIPTTPATTDDRPETVPSFPADAAPAEAEPADADAVPAAAALAATTPTVTNPAAAPGEPPAPPADASTEELADWKRSQDAWQKQRAAWVAEQRRSERERSQAEAHQRALAAAEAARERARIRKLTRPRASAGVVFLVLGVALVAGALAALAASGSPATTGAEWMIGAAVLVLVLGAGTLVVALARRRSGALAFFSILAVLALLAAVVLPHDRQVLLPGSGINTVQGGRFAQILGTTWMYVQDRDDEPVVVDLWQASGNINVEMAEGSTVRLEVVSTSPSRAAVGIDQARMDGDISRFAGYSVGESRRVITIGDGDPDLVLRVWLGSSAWLSIRGWGQSEVFATLDPLPDQWMQWDHDTETNLLEPTPIPSTEPGATGEGAL
ncbi:PspC domain-containing protein [Protaetiibacter larvae]|uniref:PspC domain-containing protein n=1 Tax=Protaetiibacter larvae TaxID=2592654 RepID=A0A5C1Y432_9MICO|nr:PspC domain-containing protein [Protaetiibacter larvae]